MSIQDKSIGSFGMAVGKARKYLGVFVQPNTKAKQEVKYGKRSKPSTDQFSSKRTEYKNPKSGVIPQSKYNNNIIWVEMRAYRIIEQVTNVRSSLGNFEPTPYFFKFIAPNELLETIQHTWTEYESLMGRIAQKSGEVMKGWTELKGAGKGAMEVIERLWGEKGTGGRTLLETIEDSLGAVGEQTPVQNYRVDGPLTYRGSERRHYDLTFNLVEEGQPFHDIIEPVRMLQKLAAPEVVKGLVRVNIPHVFNIHTTPFDWLGIKYAALKTIQPTFKGPFIDGMPTSCELTLSFESLAPMYAPEFNIENRISISRSEHEILF